jgi:Chaperone of endosialidase
MAAFNRFGKKWASTGALDNPSDAEADAGFIYLGPEPPTVEEFNSLFAWNDEKDNWLYGQIADVIRHDGTAPVENDLTQLLVAINELIYAGIGAGTTAFVKRAGDSMAGFLSLHADPTSAMHAATKRYVDQFYVNQNLFVQKAGDTMTGNLGTQQLSATQVTIDGVGESYINFGKERSHNAAFITTTDGARRWLFSLGDNSAETGNNAGSNYVVGRYDDWGTFLGIPLSINRATGQVNFETDPTINGQAMNYVRKTGDWMNGELHNSAPIFTPYLRAYSNNGQWGASEIAFGKNDNSRWALFTESNGNAHFSKIDNGNYIGKMAFTNTEVTTEGPHYVTDRLYATNGVAFNANRDFSAFEVGGLRYFRWQGDGWDDVWNMSNGDRSWSAPGKTLMVLNGGGQLWVNGNILAVGVINSSSSINAAGDIVGENITARTNIGGWGVVAGNNGFYSGIGGINVGGSISTQQALWAAGIGCGGRYSGGDMELVGMISGDPIIGRSNIHAYLDVLCDNQGYKAGGGLWAAISDERIKQDITPYERGLADVLLLEPKAYNYTEESGYDTSVRHVGLISQEVQPVVPEMVYVNTTIGKRNEYPGHEYPEGFPEEMKVKVEPRPTSDIQDLLCMDASPITFMLINAIKEIVSRLQALEGV